LSTDETDINGTTHDSYDPATGKTISSDTTLKDGSKGHMQFDKSGENVISSDWTWDDGTKTHFDGDQSGNQKPIKASKATTN
jgi:hypothetical protein